MNILQVQQSKFKISNSPKLSADNSISPAVPRHRIVPVLLIVGPADLVTAFPGEFKDWLLCLLIVGSRATNDALCLKLEDALLISKI